TRAAAPRATAGCGHPASRARGRVQERQKGPPMTDRPAGAVQYITPAGLPTNPAFTQVVAVSGPVRTVYVGMQNAVDASRTIVGRGDIAAQAEQVLKNVETCLAA